MQPILLHLVAALLYGALAFRFWRHGASSVRRAAAPTGLPRAERALLLVALLAHGAGLYLNLFPGESMRFGFGPAISLMIWLAICFYWIETLYTPRLQGLHALILPAGVLSTLIPIAFPGGHLLLNADSPAFRAHFIVAMLAYSLFTLAALHAIVMAVAERQLHGGVRLSRSIASLPPLLTMESLLFRLIGTAFVLLTLTLVSGVLFSETLFGRPFQLDHKTIFAVASWLLFATLLAGRRLWGWRGRRALRWTLAGFVTLLLAYVGSRFVIEFLLSRGT